jgi:DNA (cytosine-5)-methyltransferase 1
MLQGCLSSSFRFDNSNYNYSNTNTNVSSHLSFHRSINLANMAKQDYHLNIVGSASEGYIIKSKGIMSKIKHGSFFSGIDGFGFAAKKVGWENSFHVEIDDYCQKTIKQNFSNAVIYGDIRFFEAHKYKGAIDVVSGGFPCQNISISGKGEGIYGAKSGLWTEYYRAIKEINPKCVVIENSPELLKRGFEQIICDFSEIGYDIEWQCFCASDFGYPHQRERLFVIAYPTIQRWRGLLYLLKRGIIEKNKKTNSLDSSCHPFLRFEQRFGEPPVFRVDDGLSKRLDVIKRLGALGNSIVPDIAIEIFKSIELNVLN